MEDVPLLLKSENVKDIEGAITVVCMSLPSNFRDFIMWVAEIRRHEDDGQSLSPEEMRRLAMKVCSYNFNFIGSPYTSQNPCVTLTSSFVHNIRVNL